MKFNKQLIRKEIISEYRNNSSLFLITPTMCVLIIVFPILAENRFAIDEDLFIIVQILFLILFSTLFSIRNPINQINLKKELNFAYIKKEVDILQLSNTPTLLPNLTLIENTIYFTSSLEVDGKIIDTTIEKYNLGSYKAEELKNYSSGMIKRAELAIADMKEPDVLCIDEPLNYLDKEGVDHLQNLINERTDNNKSNVLSSQEISGLLKNKETVNLDEI